MKKGTEVNELRCLEALVSSCLEDRSVVVRIEVVGKSGKPSLVVVKKDKASLTNNDDVPFDDVRLVIDANGDYCLFVHHFDLVRRGSIDTTQEDQVKKVVKEVSENRPCPGVDWQIVE